MICLCMAATITHTHHGTLTKPLHYALMRTYTGTHTWHTEPTEIDATPVWVYANTT